MFFAKGLVALCALSPLAYASPLSSYRRQPAAVPAGVTALTRRDDPSNGSFSFDNWHGNSNLNGFDGFYGNDNFSGSKNKETIIIEEKLQCSKRDIKVIQQKLAILLEVSKRILLEQVCDVVTQVIIIEQIHHGYRQFGNDVGRKSGKNVGYDKNIASKFNGLFDSNTGDLSFNDLGFSGADIGSNLAQFNDNWDQSSSPSEVDAALAAVVQALHIEGAITPGSSQNGVPAPPAAPSDSAAPPAPPAPSASASAAPAPPAPSASAAPAPSASAAPARRRFNRR